MVVADGGIGADGAGGAAAGAGDFGVADGVLSFVRYDGFTVEWEEGLGVLEKRRGDKRRTAGQQNPPQQDSPATQKVSPQHVDPFGMQKGAKLEEVGMQHCTVRFISASSVTAIVPCVTRATLTIRVETLAAHVPRTEVIRTAGEHPCLAGSDVVVQRRCQGCEYGSVGSGRMGEKGRRGDTG